MQLRISRGQWGRLLGVPHGFAGTQDRSQCQRAVQWEAVLFARKPRVQKEAVPAVRIVQKEAVTPMAAMNVLPA